MSALRCWRGCAALSGPCGALNGRSMVQWLSRTCTRGSCSGRSMCAAELPDCAAWLRRDAVRFFGMMARPCAAARLDAARARMLGSARLLCAQALGELAMVPRPTSSVSCVKGVGRLRSVEESVALRALSKRGLTPLPASLVGAEALGALGTRHATRSGSPLRMAKAASMVIHLNNCVKLPSNLSKRGQADSFS